MSQAKPRIAVHKFASCDGCQLALLNAGEALVELAQLADIAHFAEGGWYAPGEPVDIALVEGSISAPEDAERIRAVRASARYLVTLGACATAGGVQALRNGLARAADWLGEVYASPEFIRSLPDSLPVAAYVPVDLEIHGCPVSTEQVLEAVGDLLRGAVPAPGADPVCTQCKRRNLACVLVNGGQPCLGPVTRSGCGALCPAVGRACYGCYGPAGLVNAAALARRFEALGLGGEDIAGRFLFITPAAEPFRSIGQGYRERGDG